MNEQPKMDPKYAVMIPCSQDDFSKFISGLLGKPQTIGRYHRAPFDVSRQEIENTYHLVHQRVTQQNNASLIQFTVKILYSDDSSVLLNSFDDFVHYNEIRPIVSVGALLNWTYLIHFPDRKVPEKQQIEVAFVAPAKSAVIQFSGEEALINVASPWHLPGVIKTEIQHTARTWGVDIDSLLEGHIKSFARKQGKCRAWITKHSGNVGLIAAFFFLISTYVSGYVASNHFLTEQLARIQEFASSSATPSVSEKLDFMLRLIAEGSWPRFSFYIGMAAVFLLLLSILFGIVVAALAENGPASFVVLSQSAKTNKDEILRKEERRWVAFLGSIVVDFAAALAAHTFFSHVLSKMLH